MRKKQILDIEDFIFLLTFHFIKELTQKSSSYFFTKSS